MNPFRASASWCRVTAWTVIAAMLLPTLQACTTTAGLNPGEARLDGLVVDGNRLAQAREAGFAIITRYGGVREEAYAGAVLRVGDRIDTGPRADAVIRYATGSEVVLRPSSGGRIGSLSDFIGEVFVKVKGIFSVETTFVRAGARGTAYVVRTHARGATSVVVIEGTVDVGSTTGAWPTVPLGAGTMAVAHPRAPQPEAADPNDLRRTQEWVERVERLAPPPSGVSRAAIIGAAFAAAIAAAAIIAATRGKGSSDRSEPSTTTTPGTTRDPTRPPPAGTTRDSTRPPPAGTPRDPK